MPAQSRAQSRANLVRHGLGRGGSGAVGAVSVARLLLLEMQMNECWTTRCGAPYLIRMRAMCSRKCND